VAGNSETSTKKNLEGGEKRIDGHFFTSHRNSKREVNEKEGGTRGRALLQKGYLLQLKVEGRRQKKKGKKGRGSLSHWDRDRE